MARWPEISEALKSGKDPFNANRPRDGSSSVAAAVNRRGFPTSTGRRRNLRALNTLTQKVLPRPSFKPQVFYSMPKVRSVLLVKVQIL